jgi:hypothetical protein
MADATETISKRYNKKTQPLKFTTFYNSSELKRRLKADQKAKQKEEKEVLQKETQKVGGKEQQNPEDNEENIDPNVKNFVVFLLSLEILNLKF